MDILRRESVLLWQDFNFCYETGANWALGQPPLEVRYMHRPKGSQYPRRGKEIMKSMYA